jgi:hypothetical protein
MTFIRFPGAVSIQGNDSVSMKRDASAPSDAASGMVSSHGMDAIAASLRAEA